MDKIMSKIEFQNHIDQMESHLSQKGLNLVKEIKIYLIVAIGCILVMVLSNILDVLYDHFILFVLLPT